MYPHTTGRKTMYSYYDGLLNISNQNKERIHIVIGQWDFSMDYARHGAVLITSILENTRNPVTVHIFHNEEVGLKNPDSYHNNLEKYSKIADKYSTEIQYHTINLPDWIYSDKRKRFQTLTPGALFRLYIPDVLVSIDRVIYLDCDMVVTTDLGKIWSHPIDNKAIAACRDASSAAFVFKKYGKTYTKLGIKEENYFNSGFLIMDLTRIRELNYLPDKGLEFLYEHTDDVECLDQDALNYLFKDDVFYLDAKYNIGTRVLRSYSVEYQNQLDKQNYQDCVLHYYGQTKPWRVYLGKIDLPYWYYLSLTPWNETYAQFVQNMLDAFPSDVDDAVYNKYPVLLRSEGWRIGLKNMFVPAIILLKYYWSAFWKIVLKQ